MPRLNCLVMFAGRDFVTGELVEVVVELVVADGSLVGAAASA
jgi:hypothetical protein